jgi:hypothetical protein
LLDLVVVTEFKTSVSGHFVGSRDDRTDGQGAIKRFAADPIALLCLVIPVRAIVNTGIALNVP